MTPSFRFAAALALAPSLACAQPNDAGIVPALQQPGATASASASASVGTAQPATGGQQLAALPAGMPPGVRLLGPSAPLSPKERRAARLATRWASARYMPQAGADGVVRFPYGVTIATVVCAPLRVCDLALQPGEVVNNVNLGDKVRWSVMPGTSGSPEGLVTHMLIKPLDAGLRSSLTVLTNRRAYSVELVSTQRRWVPHTGFTYPDDQAQAWQGYQATMTVNAAYQTAAATGPVTPYRVECANNPPWTPQRVWTDGLKTHIEFPGPLNSGAPVLVGLTGGGWFSQPIAQVVNYRVVGNGYVADSVLHRGALILGVGDEQLRCVLTKETSR